MRALSRILLIALAAANLLPAPENEKPYGWPLAIRDGLSSTFQEFRSNHFHAGIDLRTFKRTGFPVLAITDGAIEQVSVSNRGYGRSLTLRHSDGRRSLYSHLEKFRGDIEAIVRRRQAGGGERYFGALVLPRPLPVRRGEVIAFSGESGYGFAHLHLEIRDGLNQALNPLMLLANPSPDGQAPLLKGILLRSRGGSLVNGDCGEFYFKLRQNGSNYAPDESLTVTGPFDLSLHTVDLSDARHVVAPYSLEVRMDGRPVFQTAFDCLTRDDNNQLGMLYDMAYSNSSSYFFNLCSQSGFTLERTGVRWTAFLQQMPPGWHELQIVVRDQQQNQALAVVPFRKAAAAPVLPPRRISEAAGSINGIMQRLEISTFVNQDDVVVKVRDFPLPAERLKLRIIQGDREQAVPAMEYGAGVYFCFKPLNHEMLLQMRFELSDGRQLVEVRQKTLQAVFLEKNLKQIIRFRDFSAEFGSTSVLEPKVLLLEQAALWPEYPLLAGPVKLGPSHFAFLDAVFFKFRIPANEFRTEQLGIFKYGTETKRWNYVASLINAEPGYVSSRVLTAGTFALLRDIFPPAISFGGPASRHLEKLKRLTIHFSDRGKGIDEGSIGVFLNGRKVDGEFDPDWSHMMIEELTPLQQGRNFLLVRVSDFAGNLSERNYEFSLH